MPPTANHPSLTTMTLNRKDLLSLEDYASQRNEFRARVIAHKKLRTVHVGSHLTFVFEDRLSVLYQVQEMLRIERIFEAPGIQEELDAYNPLIPDGSNLKATMLIEYSDADERKRQLLKLRDIENRIELTVGSNEPVVAIADEDLPRSNEEKTSAVHFLRFELSKAMIADWHGGAEVTLRSTHPELEVATRLHAAEQNALGADFA